MREQVFADGSLATTKSFTPLLARGLNANQKATVDAYIECDGDVALTAKRLGKKANTVHECINSSTVQAYLMRYTGAMARRANGNPDFNITKTDRLNMLWLIAKRGTEDLYDKEGNCLMQNPAASISAIRTISDLVGDWAPKEQHVKVEVTHKDISEQQLDADIHALTAEYERLQDMTTEEEVREITTLDKVTSVDPDTGHETVIDETYVETYSEKQDSNV